jgi:hypothetical protein
MLKSLKLGLDIREALEDMNYEQAISDSNKRIKELINEGTLPKWSYFGEAQLIGLLSINLISELHDFEEYFGKPRAKEIIFALGSYECLGIQYSESFFLSVCDLESLVLNSFPLYHVSKKYKNNLWKKSLLVKNPMYIDLIPKNSLSADSRSILSLGKLFTRNLIFDFNFIQQKTFLKNQRLQLALNELLDNEIIAKHTDESYEVDLKLRNKSAFHRDWANLIGHFYTMRMLNIRRQVGYNNHFLDEKTTYRSIAATDSCLECTSISKTRLNKQNYRPPFHLGCRCTFVAIPPDRGAIKPS